MSINRSQNVDVSDISGRWGHNHLSYNHPSHRVKKISLEITFGQFLIGQKTQMVFSTTKCTSHYKGLYFIQSKHNTFI